MKGEADQPPVINSKIRMRGAYTSTVEHFSMDDFADVGEYLGLVSRL